MAYDKKYFERLFSEARLKKYFARYPDNEQLAIEHYKWNTKLAESLLPSLSVFEVALRNALIHELERYSNKEDWYNVFPNTVGLKGLNNYITAAAKHIGNRHEIVSPSKINAELTLGFWVSLFNAEYELTLWKHLRRAFPYLPKRDRQRKNISAPLNAIRNLRNRVYHYECISWNLSWLSVLHERMVQVIGWIDPDLEKWLRGFDRFPLVVTAMKNTVIPRR